MKKTSILNSLWVEAIAELDAEFDTIEAERLEKKTEDEFKALGEMIPDVWVGDFH